MLTRCKFKCMTKTQMADGFSVMFSPVTCGSTENREFFKWTPSGRLEMGIISEAVANQFIPGKDYYIDISAAE